MVLDKKPINKRVSQKGSALVYILIAIALLAALTASFMQPSSQQTTAQSSFKTITELKSQISFVRSSIQECVLNYPDGEDGLVGTNNFPYPINPSSAHLTSPSADDALGNIRCPGNPGGASTDHADIFGGSSGKFLPPIPDLFEPWQYYSGGDGVFFFTQTDKTDAFLQTALQKLDDQFSECEADIIDATSGDIELLSGDPGDPICPDGSTCFRVWVITQGSAVYNGDTDGEELAATCP
jgi:type II secretory pathway pseudopilin PulG